MNTEKGFPASRYRKLDRMVARIKEILQCIICLEIVGCPALQCEAGHLMCGQCRDKLEENTCPTCRQPLIAVRNRVVEQVVEALPKECPNAIHGCQDLLDEDEVDTHRVTCPFHQYSCPRSPCPWVGYKLEIIGHMRDTHPQHVLSSNRQTVKVPVKWDEVSWWIMIFHDEVLVLKFSVDQATNFLLGSFECLGRLNPVDSIIYHMTVKRGDRETTLSGNVGPERSAADRQCVEEWDSVFPRCRFDEHPGSGCSTGNKFIEVDVLVEDNRREAAGQSSDNVKMQSQANDGVEGGLGDVAGGGNTRQDCGGYQSDQTTYRVIHKLGAWLGSESYDFRYYSSSMSEIDRIIKETNKKIISGLVKSIDDINKMIRSDLYGNYLCIEMHLCCLSRDLAETKIKLERARASGGRYLRMQWLLPYLLIVEQAVYQAISRYVHKLPAVNDVKLEKLLTARERRLRDESAQRTLRWAHGLGASQGVDNIIWHMGGVYKKSKEEISSLQSDAAAISWSKITPSS